jgi:hypothetical protein
LVDDAPPDGGWRALTVSGDGAHPPTVPLRPMTIGDLLDEPFLLFRAHLRTILLVAAAGIVPSQLLQGWLAREAIGSLRLDQLVNDPEGFSLAAEGAGAGGAAVGLVNGLLVLPIVVAIIARIAVSSALGERLDGGAAWRAAVRRLPSLAATWVLAIAAVVAMPLLGAGVAVAGSPAAGALLVLLGLPAAFTAFVLVAPAPVIAVVERRGPLAAIRRSAALVRPRFWTAAGALSLALLVLGVVQIAVATVPSLVAFALPEGQAWLLTSTGSSLASLVTTPYTVLVVVLVYLDALVRREALDVALLTDPPGRARAAR